MTSWNAVRRKGKKETDALTFWKRIKKNKRGEVVSTPGEKSHE